MITGYPWKLASSSKDGSVRIWDVKRWLCLLSLTSHTMSVTCLRWSGLDLIVSGSEDKTVKVWRAKDGVMCRTLQGHGHWVNVLALNTDYVMRTGHFDPSRFTGSRDREGLNGVQKKEMARKRYESVVKDVQNELLVTGSDDHTLFLWRHASDKKPMVRMTGRNAIIVNWNLLS